MECSENSVEPRGFGTGRKPLSVRCLESRSDLFGRGSNTHKARKVRNPDAAVGNRLLLATKSRNSLRPVLRVSRTRLRRSSQKRFTLRQIDSRSRFMQCKPFWILACAFLPLSLLAACAQNASKPVEAEGHQWWQHAVF